MLTLRRQSANVRGEEPGQAWPRARVVSVSVFVHLLVVAALWQVFEVPATIGALLQDRPSQPVAERLRFLAVAPRPIAEAVSSRPRARTMEARPIPDRPPAPPSPAPTPAQPAVPVVPPQVVPGGIAPPRPAGPATGPLAPGHPDARGVQPAYTEPRIWVEVPAATGVALEGDAKLDSAVAASIARFQDSLVANGYEPTRFERGDWTYVTKDGKKFGVDRQFIRLGRFSIPTALLGLLPLNQQGNPVAYDRDKRLAAMRSEILEHAQVAMNEEDFRRAVKSIRDRKEKERKALLQQQKKKDEAARTVSSPGRESR